MAEIHDSAATAFHPKSSLPMTTGTAPVDSSQLAGASLLSPGAEKSQGIVYIDVDRLLQGYHVPPVMDQKTTGALLGYTGRWLRQKCHEHPFFLPTNEPREPNAKALYSRMHFAYILFYVLHKDLVKLEEVYRAWMERRQADASAVISPPRLAAQAVSANPRRRRAPRSTSAR